ncbi:MAG: DNA mismatch repair endonuclease MutL [Thermodesulfobacteriota bacterium]
MSSKIHLLPEEIAQTIAAGEVVERPASVVKELMENAIDAGSSEVVVELEAGGLQLIRVYDNGEGMVREDVPLALQRYATSKIKTAEDLFAIHTLGFRGEALPSIASVSKMIIQSRVSNSISGTRIAVEGGAIKSISEVGCPPGTEVEVKNIFYNLPVKRKFLKSIRSELRYVLFHFLRLSLSHSSISFKFIHDGRMLHEYVKADSPLVRIEAILGREIFDQIRPCEFEDNEIKIRGFTSLPSVSRANSEAIYIYVNRRFVKDRMIYKAITETYRHVLPAGRFPIVILFITLPPYAVDVNIHPTKAEVRFREPERIFHAVAGTIGSIHEEKVFSDRKVTSAMGVIKDSVPPWLPPKRSFDAYLPLTRRDEAMTTPMVREEGSLEWGVEARAPIRLLGQVQGTYIVCEGDEGVIFIDQHAAHERILFDQYKNQYERKAIVSEKFLVPVSMELSAEESFILDSHLEELESMGFEIDPIGERVYAIRSKPSLIDQEDPKTIVRELLDELSSLRRGGKGTEGTDKILITLSCHSAIRGNSTLRKEEMEKLVETLYPFNFSKTCPHGRPIFFLFREDELAKQFKRKP